MLWWEEKFLSTQNSLMKLSIKFLMNYEDLIEYSFVDDAEFLLSRCLALDLKQKEGYFITIGLCMTYQKVSNKYIT